VKLPPLKTVLIIIGVALLCLVVAGVAVAIIASNSVTIIVEEQTLTLSVDKTTLPPGGGQITLTATQGIAQSGVMVTFYQDDVSIGSIATGAGGNAIKTVTLSAPGTYTFHAEIPDP
jgi:ribulose 1,5-bisphosphate synthetase/thiazole synthase